MFFIKNIIKNHIFIRVYFPREKSNIIFYNLDFNHHFIKNHIYDIIFFTYERIFYENVRVYFYHLGVHNTITQKTLNTQSAIFITILYTHAHTILLRSYNVFNLPYMLPQFETMIVPFQQYRHWSNLVLLHIQT